MDKTERPVLGSMVSDQVPSGSTVPDQVPSGSKVSDQVPSGSTALDQVPSASKVLDRISGSMVLDQVTSGSMVPDQVTTGRTTPDQISSGSIMSLKQVPSGNMSPEQAATQSHPPGSHTALTSSLDFCTAATSSHLEEPASKRARRSISPPSSGHREEISSHSQLTVDTRTETGAWEQIIDGRGGSMDRHVSDTSHTNSAAGKGDVEKLPLDDYVAEDYQKKVQQLPRQWELTELGARHQADGDAVTAEGNSRHPVTFTLMSYNILAQDLIDMNLDLYHASSPESLDWEQRRRRLMAEIAYHNADILNLQEVQEDHFFDYLEPRLEKLGYTGCYQKRTGDKTDGCATVWKKDKFHLLRSAPVIYCRGGLLDRDNIALIVELQPVRSGQEVQDTAYDPEDKMVVANTHLLFNPRRGDIKLAQMMILLAEIDKYAYLGPPPDEPHPATSPSWDSTGTERYCPVIMSGDFNMEPYSDLYKFVISGTMKYEGLVAKELSGQQEGWRGGSHYLQRHFLSPMYGVTDLCQYHSVAVERLRQSYQSYSRASVTQGTDNTVGQGEGEKASHGSTDQCDSQAVVGQSLQIENGNSLNKQGEQSHKTDNPAGEGKVSSNTANVENSHSGDEKEERLSDQGPVSRSTGSDLPPLMPNSSGCLSHRLNLFSAYRHKVQRLGEAEDEVTTHHSRAECTVDFIFYLVDYKDVCVKEEEVEVRVVEEGHLKLLGRYGLMSGEELDQLGGIPNALLPSDHLCLLTKFLLL